ncbi:MAG: RsmE family RNA methyltransferase [Bacteroidales bacterium]|jgi:16S rRNA (uracil1498-N3)-methyltransferase|nr:RsmE family RNA methyltransferase [Bacteroidales bacterium]
MTSIIEPRKRHTGDLHHFFSGEPLSEFITLGPGESAHATRVLRLKKGDEITVTDGTGIIGYGILIDADPSKCSVRIRETARGSDSRNYSLHIGISPLSAGDRLEWFVEKAVEIGTDEITPVICSRTVKIKPRTDRLSKMVISAMKQSVKTHLTIIHEPVIFPEFIKAAHRGRKLIAHCGAGSRIKITEAVEKMGDYLIMIGPEGDFTTAEIEEATGSGFIPITLGPGRLRTETAGITACHSVYLINL